MFLILKTSQIRVGRAVTYRGQSLTSNGPSQLHSCLKKTLLHCKPCTVNCLALQGDGLQWNL